MKFTAKNIIRLAVSIMAGLYILNYFEMFQHFNRLVNELFALSVFFLIYKWYYTTEKKDKITSVMISGILALQVIQVIDGVIVTKTYFENLNGLLLKYNQKTAYAKIENIVYENIDEYMAFCSLGWWIIMVSVFTISICDLTIKKRK